jgi:hypothetical protein
MHYVYGGLIGLGIGLVLHTYIVSRANSIKTHITNEFNKLRSELGVTIAGNSGTAKKQ